MARPRKEEARDTSRAILDAALDLFSEQGFAGTSMRQIAQRVGVRESALYHHFSSKEAIFRSLVGELGPGKAVLLRHLDYDAALAVGGLPFLKRLAQLLIEEWIEPREHKFARLMLAEGPRLAARGAIRPDQFLSSALESVGVLVAELQKRKLIRKQDPSLVALELIGPLVMLRIRFLVMAPGEPDLAALRVLAEKHVDYFWRANRTIVQEVRR